MVTSRIHKLLLLGGAISLALLLWHVLTPSEQSNDSRTHRDPPLIEHASTQERNDEAYVRRTQDQNRPLRPNSTQNRAEEREARRGVSEVWSPPTAEPVAKAESMLSTYEYSPHAQASRRRIAGATTQFQNKISEQRRILGDPVQRVNRAREIIRRNRNARDDKAGVERSMQQIFSPDPSEKEPAQVNWQATEAMQRHLVLPH